jgi:hypothetical protein
VAISFDRIAEQSALYLSLIGQVTAFFSPLPATSVTPANEIATLRSQ